MTKTEERLKARQLRQAKGMSVGKIAEILGVAKSSVSKWVRDIPLTNEQRHQLMQNKYNYGAQHQGSIANRVKHSKIRQQYQQAGREKAREGDPLHLTGCMLYWAEGAKERNYIKFVNSDPDMMEVFSKFLRKSFNIAEQEITFRVNCYADDAAHLKRIKQYWLDLLDLNESNLRQSTVNVKPNSSKQRGRKLSYGVCILEVYRTEYVQHIFGAIQEYIGIDKPEWLD